MGRIALYSLAAVSAGAGWALGSLNTAKRNSPHLTYEDPHILDYAVKLESQGYITVDPPHKRSMFSRIHRTYMFSHSVLEHPDRIVPGTTHILRKKDSDEFIMLLKLGPDALKSKDQFATVCTTLFDEALAFAAFPKLPNKVGVTGTLELDGNINEPPKDGYIVLYSCSTSAKGRKSESEAILTALTSGKMLASGRAVMIEPWWGKFLAQIL